MKKTILVVSAVGAFLTPFMGSVVNVALPRIECALDLIFGNGMVAPGFSRSFHQGNI
jgi:hypothetical protein